MKFPIGTVISLPSSLDKGRDFALIVDQEKGHAWLDRDPFQGFNPEERRGFKAIGMIDANETYCLVRYLGLKISDGDQHRSALPGEEPILAEVERWGWIIESAATLVAPPDPVAIDAILSQTSYFAEEVFGDRIPGDLKILSRYLKGERVTPEDEDAMLGYDYLYLTMLQDVLPLDPKS